MESEFLTKTRSGASFRDPAGFVYFENGIPYRQVNNSYAECYIHLQESGLYDSLVKDNLLVPHQEVEDLEYAEGVFKVLKPEPIKTLTYPYEWCFSQLKQAALCTLEIQQRALRHGMILKDASPFNVQFRGTKPYLIDSLSFGCYEEGQIWEAYRQFCEQFLGPLALMSYRDQRCGQFFRHAQHMQPLELISSLLPLRSKLSFGVLTHIHLHSRLGGKGAASAKDVSLPKKKLGNLIAHLSQTVSSLSSPVRLSEWSNYSGEVSYTDTAFQSKEEIVRDFLGNLTANRALDLGCNKGLFSELLAEQGVETVAIDADIECVEALYQGLESRKISGIHPVRMDITDPTPPLGWDLEERLSFHKRFNADVAIALALIHHLAITHGIPLPKIAKFLSTCCQWLIIEFVPKQDPQVQEMLFSRSDIFSDYCEEGFLKSFEGFFEKKKQSNIPGSERSLFLFEKRD